MLKESINGLFVSYFPLTKNLARLLLITIIGEMKLIRFPASLVKCCLPVSSPQTDSGT